MRKTEELTKNIGVEELVALATKQPVMYAALKHYCINRGYAEIKRFAKRVLNMSGSRTYIMDEALPEKDNAKLAAYVIRIVSSTTVAVDMYNLFRLCDNTCEEGACEEGKKQDE